MNSEPVEHVAPNETFRNLSLGTMSVSTYASSVEDCERFDLFNKDHETALLASDKTRDRYVMKDGVSTVEPYTTPQWDRAFKQDIFTTVLELRWKWILSLFALSFLVTWLVFAFVYFGLSHLRSDWSNLGNSSHVPCIYNHKNFLNTISFSIETQHTIGYGHRYPTDHCPEMSIVIALQSIVGTILIALAGGLVFAKLTRPLKRSRAVLFSNPGVVCMHNGILTMLFRVADIRKSNINNASVCGYFVASSVTQEGHTLHGFHKTLEVNFLSGGPSGMLLWPTFIVHKIDSTSPFYRMSMQEMWNAHFEIVLVVSAVVEATGQSIEARTSYLPNEILWGHRFLEVMKLKEGHKVFDCDIFDTTTQVPTPTTSAFQQNLGLGK